MYMNKNVSVGITVSVCT